VTLNAHAPARASTPIHPGPDRPAATKLAARPAGALYVGDVMHQRMKPVGHRFKYRVYSLLLDLDRLDEINGFSPLFSVNRPNVMAFHEADHLRGSDAPTLRAHINDLLAKAELDAPAARIELACYPRIFGQVFNPLSVYYAYGSDERLVAMVYEVRNTFGENHTYVCKVGDNDVTEAGIRQSRDKLFYVSPFIEMGMRYHFRMNLPGKQIKWRILETDGTGPLLAATYSGNRKPLRTGSVLACLLQFPLLTWKIVGGIHYEALKLWLKGVRYVPRPEPPEKASFSDRRENDDHTVRP
jgi:uncharacterized protein